MLLKQISHNRARDWGLNIKTKQFGLALHGHMPLSRYNHCTNEARSLFDQQPSAGSFISAR
jgi:hypothetical protein